MCRRTERATISCGDSYERLTVLLCNTPGINWSSRGDYIFYRFEGGGVIGAHEKKKILCLTSNIDPEIKSILNRLVE
ncbi:MAG: hypothetical protein KKF68_01090 [Nanoarchaeota archaeon]|nr:hypothetical protein [Nanoarchaeota archaeon]